MMVAFIITFGLVIFLIGAVVSLEPTRFFTTLNNRKTELFVYVAAVSVRLVLGILLVFNASQSGFPFCGVFSDRVRRFSSHSVRVKSFMSQ